MAGSSVACAESVDGSSAKLAVGGLTNFRCHSMLCECVTLIRASALSADEPSALPAHANFFLLP